jgi:outer membrane immunogenic protein
MGRAAGGATCAAQGMIAITLLAATAAAADVAQPYLTAAAPIRAYSWTGPYLGVNVGYQWGYVTAGGTHPTGAAGGGQAGYNWQSGQFVFGIEADLQGSSAEDTFASWKFGNPWFGTARGRIGFALNQVLLYGTLGLAFGSLRVEAPGASESKTHFGWSAGGGAEIGITPRLSAKIEYLFVDLSEQAYLITGAHNGLATHLVRLGVNYRF